MKFVLVIALVCVVVCSAQRGIWTKNQQFAFWFNNNCDFFGSDLQERVSGERENVADVAACGCRCQARPECSHFTYNKNTKRCYLKTASAANNYRSSGEGACGFVELFKSGCCVGQGYSALVDLRTTA